MLIKLYEIDISVDCTWAQWGDWSDCSKTCGDGTRTKTRRKDVKEAHGGVCKGTDKEKESCKDKECPGKISANRFDTN